MADPILIPDEGLVAKLTSLVTNVLGVAQVRLFQNNHTPAAGDTAAAYTECNFPGYVRQALPSLSPVTVSGGVASTSTATLSWNHAGGAPSNTVYGWYMVDGGGKLIAASLNGGGPITLSGVGQTYSIQVTFTDQRSP